jgi:hypothetical protein
MHTSKIIILKISTENSVIVKVNTQWERSEEDLSNTHPYSGKRKVKRTDKLCCHSASPTFDVRSPLIHAVSVLVHSRALMSISRKKACSAPSSWQRLAAFLLSTLQVYHCLHSVAVAVLQSRHQEDNYSVDSLQSFSALITNKYITACFSVCSICNLSFSDPALCYNYTERSHTIRADQTSAHRFQRHRKTSPQKYVTLLSVQWNDTVQTM